MLAAVAINGEILQEGGQFLLAVPAAQAGIALHHLAAYERERQAPPADARPTAQPRLHRGAWVGCVAYVMLLVGVARLAAGAPTRVFARGALEGEWVQAGEWWRAWTALTLHWDAPHLVANLGAGAWFGFFAARQIGAGTAWLLIVMAAAAANLFDALLGPASYRSAGASTLVFTALGLLAAHSWRSRLEVPQRRVMRWAPLVGGVVLLGWLGSAGEGTDIVAHAIGFASGSLVGIAAAVPAVAGLLARVPQWLAGAAAMGSLVLAWWRALN